MITGQLTCGRRLNLHKEKKKTHGGIFTCLIIMAMLRMRIAKL